MNLTIKHLLQEAEGTGAFKWGTESVHSFDIEVGKASKLLLFGLDAHNGNTQPKVADFIV